MSSRKLVRQLHQALEDAQKLQASAGTMPTEEFGIAVKLVLARIDALQKLEAQ